MLAYHDYLGWAFAPLSSFIIYFRGYISLPRFNHVEVSTYSFISNIVHGDRLGRYLSIGLEAHICGNGCLQETKFMDQRVNLWFLLITSMCNYFSLLLYRVIFLNAMSTMHGEALRSNGVHLPGRTTKEIIEAQWPLIT